MKTPPLIETLPTDDDDIIALGERFGCTYCYELGFHATDCLMSGPVRDEPASVIPTGCPPSGC